MKVQGNNDSPKAFYNRFIVEYDRKYYDPSYGSPIFATHAEYEDGSLAGFIAGKIYVDPRTNLPVADSCTKSNTAADEETDFIEFSLRY